VKIDYTPEYWDTYYGSSYEETYQWGYPLELAIDTCWKPTFGNLPQSFADIGCGPGQFLNAAEKLLPSAHIYGVEIQEIPKDRIVSDKIIFSDFLEIHETLKPVDLLFVTCSMYIPWDRQVEFLKACINLTKKACIFANLYLTDKRSIPEDRLRRVIYKDRTSFAAALSALGLERVGPNRFDFFRR
jgi:SAM-dependent methyltransferase